MSITSVKAVYFSATGTTEKIVRAITSQLAETLRCAAHYHDFTLPQNRETTLAFGADDLVVFGVPVYAGRVPNVLVKYLNTLQGEGAQAIAVVVYGNRDYDDALMEACDILEHDNMRVIAGAAFVGEHAFSYTLSAQRPDADDLQKAATFAQRVAEKIECHDFTRPVVKGTPFPYRAHYQPKDASQNNFDIRKVKPKTADTCLRCGQCASLCPMGSINPDNVAEITGICIKCGACVKRCPAQAKHFDDPNYLYHKTNLEENYQRRAEVEWFV